MSDLENNNERILSAVNLCRRLQSWCKDHQLSADVVLKFCPLVLGEIEIDMGSIHVWTKWDYEDSQGPQPSFQACIENYRKRSQQKIDQIQFELDKLPQTEGEG